MSEADGETTITFDLGSTEQQVVLGSDELRVVGRRIPGSGGPVAQVLRKAAIREATERSASAKAGAGRLLQLELTDGTCVVVSTSHLFRHLGLSDVSWLRVRLQAWLRAPGTPPAAGVCPCCRSPASPPFAVCRACGALHHLACHDALTRCGACSDRAVLLPAPVPLRPGDLDRAFAAAGEPPRGLRAGMDGDALVVLQPGSRWPLLLFGLAWTAGWLAFGQAFRDKGDFVLGIVGLQVLVGALMVLWSSLRRPAYLRLDRQHLELARRSLIPGALTMTRIPRAEVLGAYVGLDPTFVGVLRVALRSEGGEVRSFFVPLEGAHAWVCRLVRAWLHGPEAAAR